MAKEDESVETHVPVTGTSPCFTALPQPGRTRHLELLLAALTSKFEAIHVGASLGPTATGASGRVALATSRQRPTMVRPPTMWATRKGMDVAPGLAILLVLRWGASAGGPRSPPGVSARRSSCSSSGTCACRPGVRFVSQTKTPSTHFLTNGETVGPPGRRGWPRR